MDYSSVAELISSDLEAKQAAGLIAAYPYLSIYAPSDAFLSALIENCIVSEKERVRELAFRCVLELYRSHGAIRWGDIRTSLVTELGTAESSRTLTAALAILAYVPLREQVLLFTSKEGVSAMDSCMSSDHPIVKAAAIREITPYLISCWLYLDVSGNIEGFLKMETPGDIKRFKEDFKDVIVDKLKQFTASIFGKGDTPRESNALCREAVLVAFGDIFYRYNSSDSHLDDWVEALLGCSHAGVTREQLRESRSVVAASLSPLIQLIVPFIAVDPYLLVHLCKDTLMRMKRSGVASIRVSRCVTGFLQMLLGSLPASSADASAVQSCGLISGLPDTMEFSSSIGAAQRPGDALLEETASSRTGTIDYINIVQFAKEWLLTEIAPSLHSVYPDEAVYSIRTCLELTSHPSLASLRFQLAPAICQNCIRLIRIATQIPAMIGTRSNVGFSNILIRSWINPASATALPLNPWCNTNVDQPDAECRRVIAQLVPMLTAGAVPLYYDDADASNLESTVSTTPIALSRSGASFFNPPQTTACDLHLLSRITPVAELLSYAVLAARYVGRGKSSTPVTTELKGIIVAIIEHLTTNALFSCGAGALDRSNADIWLTRLSTEVAVLLLSDPSYYGSICAPDLLYEVLHNDVVMSILVDPFKETRGFLVAALCRTYCRIVPGLVTSLIEKHAAVDALSSPSATVVPATTNNLLDTPLVSNTPTTPHAKGAIRPGRHLRGLGAGALLFGQEFAHLQYMSEETSEGSDLTEFLKADCAQASKEVEGFVHAGLIMLAEFSSCLSWPANLKAAGEAPQLSFICMLSELCRFILPIAPSSVSPSYPIPVPVRESINLWAQKQLSDVVESLLWMLKEGSFPSLSAQRNLVLLFAHIIGFLFGITGQSTIDKASELIALLKRDLMNALPRDARYKATLKASDDGGLGFGAAPFSGSKPSIDDIAIRAIHPASDPATQLFAIMALETVALYHRVVAQQCVAVLQEFLSFVGISHMSPLICTSSGKLLPGRVDKCMVADASVIERAMLALQRTIASSPSKTASNVSEPPSKPATPPIRSKYDRLKNLGMNDVFENKSNIGSGKTDTAIKALLQGSKITSLSTGVEATDATRCVFKWPIFPGAAPLTSNIGEEYGLFRKPSNLGYANKSTGFEASRPAVSDTIALIDDVLNGHLYPRGKDVDSVVGANLPADALVAKMLHTRTSAVQRAHINTGVLTPTADVFSSCASRSTSSPYLQLSPWTVISGSSDVMTVSACTLIDPVSHECELKVRAYNSSGFKIPYFALSVGIGAPSSSQSSNPSAVRTDNGPAASLRPNMSPQVEGEEYLAPGAIVERSWRITLLRFDAIALQIFVVYSELTAPDTCLDLFVPSGSGSSATGGVSAIGRLGSLGQSMTDVTSPTSPTAGKRLDATALVPHGLNATRALVPCKELVIPPLALLCPYGFGSLTRMRSFTTETNGSEQRARAPLGVPLSVYQSLQHRLESRHSTIFHVSCQLPAGTSLSDAVCTSSEHIWDSGVNLAVTIAALGRVELPTATASAVWGNRLSQDLVWAFQTLWGEELCVRLSVTSTPAASKDYSANSVSSGIEAMSISVKNEWSGMLQIFSSSQRCIDALANNASGFLQCLTGDIHWRVKSHAMIASNMLMLPPSSTTTADRIARRADVGSAAGTSTVAAAVAPKPFDAFGFDIFASAPAPTIATKTTTATTSSNLDIFGMFPSTLTPPPPPVFQMGVDPFALTPFVAAPIGGNLSVNTGFSGMPNPAPLLAGAQNIHKTRDRMSSPPVKAPSVELFGTDSASNTSSATGTVSASLHVDLLSLDLPPTPPPPVPSGKTIGIGGGNGGLHANHEANKGLSLLGETNMAATRRAVWLSEDRIK